MIGPARMIILVTRMIEQGVMKTSKQSYICLAKLAASQFFVLHQSSWHHPSLLGTEFALLIILVVHKQSSWPHPRMCNHPGIILVISGRGSKAPEFPHEKSPRGHHPTH